VHGVNPAWRQVDRIVAERTSQIDGREVGGVTVPCCFMRQSFSGKRGWDPAAVRYLPPSASLAAAGGTQVLAGIGATALLL